MRAGELWPAAVLLLAACSGDGMLGIVGRVAIRTEQVQYTPGDMLRVSIRNESSVTLYYSMCGTIVDRVDPDPGSYGFGRLCALAIDQPVPIRPGGVLRDSIEIPAQTPAGTYRIRQAISTSRGRPLPEPFTFSNTFAIE